MAIALVGTPQGNTGNSGTASCNVPAGITAGTVMFAVVAMEQPSGSITSNDGWTEIRDQGLGTFGPTVAAYWKIYDGIETSGSWGLSGGGGAWAMGTFALSGVDTTTPVPVNNGSTTGSNSTTVTSSGVTPPNANSAIVLYGGQESASGGETASGYAIATSNPGAWTEVIEQARTNCNCFAAFGIRAAITATGNGTFTTSGSHRSVGGMFAVNEQSIVGPALVKTFDGVNEQTGVKTYIGPTTLANTKTVNGVGS